MSKQAYYDAAAGLYGQVTESYEAVGERDYADEQH